MLTGMMRSHPLAASAKVPRPGTAGAIPATTISVGIQLSFRSGSEPTVVVTTAIYRLYAGIIWMRGDTQVPLSFG